MSTSSPTSPCDSADPHVGSPVLPFPLLERQALTHAHHSLYPMSSMEPGTLLVLIECTRTFKKKECQMELLQKYRKEQIRVWRN